MYIYNFFYSKNQTPLVDNFIRVLVSITSRFITERPLCIAIAYPFRRTLCNHTYNYANNGACIKMQLYCYRA